jgi:hypothetical protein
MFNTRRPTPGTVFIEMMFRTVVADKFVEQASL